MSDEHKAIFEQTLHNQFEYLKEETFSGDIARVGEILGPIWRRAFPQIFGKELVGIQPLNGPSGHIFSIRHYYGDADSQSLTKPGVRGGTNTPAGDVGSNDTFHAPNSVLVFYGSEAEMLSNIDGGAHINGGATPAAITDANITGAISTGTSPVVIYSESIENPQGTEFQNVLLLKVETDDISGLLALNDNVGDTGVEFTEIIYNQAGYKTLLKGYSGPFKTFEGEQKGSDMYEIGFNIVKKLVEAETRKMRASYTIESAQDLKATHGKDLAAELINHLTYEITASINRDILHTIKGAAAIDPAFDMAPGTGDTDGRWSAERYRTLYTQLIRMSNKIAETTLRNPGNFVIGSSDLVSVLESLPGFSTAPIQSTIDTSTATFNETGSAFVGTLGGRFNVYRDVDAKDNNTIVGFKGASNMDCGVVWSPYRPIEMYKVTREESAQPRIIFSERSAITESPFAADNYYRMKDFPNLFG